MKVQCLGLFLILICVNSAFSTVNLRNKNKQGNNLKPAGTSHVGTIQDAGFNHILYNPPIFNSKKDFHIKFQTPEEAAKIEAMSNDEFKGPKTVSASVLDSTKRNKVIQIGIPAGERSVETYTYHLNDNENFLNQRKEKEGDIKKLQATIDTAKQIGERANALKSK